MGTPDFAVSSLAALYEDGGYDICGVFTRADKARNRGMKLSYSPVKEYAVSRDLQVYQPESLRDGEAAQKLKDLKPDLVAVVAYGMILPEEILNIPPLGAINVHASLLPKYRGSAPIQWSIINGEKTTGVTTMYMVPKLDSGDIIDVAETDIGQEETYGQLHDRLKTMGAQLLLKTLGDIKNGCIKKLPQDESLATYAPSIKKADTVLDWSRPARDIVNKVRGLNPKPGARTVLGGTSFKIFKTKKCDIETRAEPGKIISAGGAGIQVACGKGEAVLITELQAPGGKRMSASDYLRGHSIEID
jgi:methionyl-tRNA formyltransferase